MGTQEDIQNRINGRLIIQANKTEGGFSQDIIGSVAYELANIYDTELDTIVDRCFVKTAKGSDLDKVGADYGLPRRQSASAYVNLEITGLENATVNTLVKAIYNNLVFTVQEYNKIGSSGVVTVKAKCDTSGTIGNVEANTITQFITQYQGLLTVNNPEPAYDGFDVEDDETYRQRLLDYLAEDATNANEAQYRQWAMSITGVQKAVVKSAETMGAGNVGVYISAIDTTVSDELIQAVKDYINSVQPINATLIVNALDYVSFYVYAEVVLKDGYAEQDVVDEFTLLFEEYLKTIDNVVSYFKVSDLLYACSGVEDVTNYTLNDGTSSVTLDDTEYPVLGGVTIES